jgi:hypothetical protein
MMPNPINPTFIGFPPDKLADCGEATYHPSCLNAPAAKAIIPVSAAMMGQALGSA